MQHRVATPEEEATAMNDHLLGWFATFAVFVILVLMFVIAAWLMPRTMGSRTRDMFCAWRRRRVTVTFVTDGEHPIGVVSCTAFADPLTVTCGAPCVGAKDHLPAATQRPAERVAD
jgi:hypothetical protein